VRACVCDRITVGMCWYCSNPRTVEERRAFVRAGIPKKGAAPVVTAWSKEAMFEQERQRLAKKRKKKKA